MSWTTTAGNLARVAVRRTTARARWLANGVRWSYKVAHKKVRSVWHGGRRLTEAGRNHVVNAIKGPYRAVRRPLRAASRRKSHLQERWRYYRSEWSIEREIETIVTRDRLLVAGPWLSEVGFETLYWVPFLHWLKTAFHIDPSRVVAVSRGGVAAWYQGVAERYVEIWDEIDPAEFATRNAARGVVKHYEPGDMDRDVLDRVARRIGTTDFDVLHPGLMYRLFTLYWSGQRAMGFVDAHLRFTTMTAPALIDPALLPQEYVAVKFYAARSLPDTPEIRAHLRATVAALSERLPVVLLDTGLVLEDDHADYTFATRGRVTSARPWRGTYWEPLPPRPIGSTGWMPLPSKARRVITMSLQSTKFKMPGTVSWVISTVPAAGAGSAIDLPPIFVSSVPDTNNTESRICSALMRRRLARQ